MNKQYACTSEEECEFKKEGTDNNWCVSKGICINQYLYEDKE
jgi:hypothetical protein